MIVGRLQQVADCTDPIVVEGESRATTKNAMEPARHGGGIMRFVARSPGGSPTQMAVPPLLVFVSDQGSQCVGIRREFGERRLDQVGVGIDEPAVEQQFRSHVSDGS